MTIVKPTREKNAAMKDTTVRLNPMALEVEDGNSRKEIQTIYKRKMYFIK